MAHQVSYIDYGDYRYKVGDLIKISSSHEYLYLATTGSSRTNCPNISKDTRKITQLWASDSNLSVSNPIVTAYYSGSYRYGGGAIRPEQIAVGSGGQKIKSYVYYNANGGSGAPSTQTKMYGSVLTLSSVKPTRPGYNFVGWNTNPNGSGTNYSPGQQYGVDSNLTLYAIWSYNSYLVSYDANGGTGAPNAQTKIHGEDLALSSIWPTRVGYEFLGWAEYPYAQYPTTMPGNVYRENASKTFYAVWRANSFVVTYDANGGTNAPASQTKTYGVSLTLSSSVPTRENYQFAGWGTASTSTTAIYQPGGQYTANASITLYAIWTLDYTNPVITNVSADRCNSNGILTEEDAYIKVSFQWVTDRPVSEIKIEYKTEESSYWDSVSVSATGTSGTVSKIIGGSLSTEYVYNVRITVYDTVGNTTVTKNVPSMHYIIDIRSTGKGIAFGQPSSRDAFDVNMESYFKHGLNSDMDIRNRADYYDKYDKKINNGLAVYTSSGIDPDTTLEELILTSLNTPMGGGKGMYVRTMFYSEKSTSANRAQYAVPYDNFGSMYHRYYYGGSWSAWVRIVRDDEIDTVNERITNMTNRLTALENNLPCRVRQGTKVVATTGGSTEVVVFTGSQLNTLFGVNNASNVNTTVILMNGDIAADTKMFATYYRNGNWIYKVDRAYSGGQIRVNYIAVYSG